MEYSKTVSGQKIFWISPRGFANSTRQKIEVCKKLFFHQKFHPKVQKGPNFWVPHTFMTLTFQMHIT